MPRTHFDFRRERCDGTTKFESSIEGKSKVITAGTSIFNIRHSLFDIALLLALSNAAHAQGKYQTLGPDGCGSTKNNCHASENKNMVDKHKNSLDFADADNATTYAEKSGIAVADMKKGNSKCMSCHGTVISGRETKEAEEGVSCESCHGAGSGYKDVHAEGPKGGPGVVRDGYTKSLPLGMKDLEKAEILADACVRCHLLTDQKILASGHPDGMKFNYKSGMKSVAKHWNYRDPGNIPEAGIFKSAVARKGPTGVKPTKDATPVPTPVVDNTPLQPRVRKPPPPPRAPVVDLGAAPPPTKEPIVLPPFPTIMDSTRIDQTLLLLKRRLELLYKKTGN
jgi:hypothetical protein